MIFNLLIILFSPLAKHFIRKIEGLDNLPDKAPYIIAINHASYADPIFLTVALRKKLKHDVGKIYFIAKRKFIWRIFTLGLAEKLFNLIIINPKDKKDVIRRGQKTLKKKKILTIFFEGTRSWDGMVQKGKTGTVRLALKSHLPVVPVALAGTYEFWGRGIIFPRYQRNVRVIVGQPLYFNQYYHAIKTKKLLHQLTDIITYEVKKLLKQK